MVFSRPDMELLATERRIAQIRCQQGEQHATEVAAGALMTIDYWASRPKPRRTQQRISTLTLPCPHCRRLSNVSRRQHGESI
jgi:hypothetical protein